MLQPELKCVSYFKNWEDSFKPECTESNQTDRGTVDGSGENAQRWYSYIFKTGVLWLLFWVQNVSESYFMVSANCTITFCVHEMPIFVWNAECEKSLRNREKYAETTRWCKFHIFNKYSILASVLCKWSPDHLWNGGSLLFFWVCKARNIVCLDQFLC